jgi:naringenin degradation protein FdeC
MNIVGIENITYGVEDMDASIRFHDDLGMERIDAGRNGTDFRLLNGAMVQLRGADDPALPPPKIDWLPHLNRSTVREVIWGVGDREALAAIGAELGKDREVTQDDAGVLHTVDETGFHIGFALSAARRLAAEPTAVNTVGFHARKNRQAEGTRRRRVSPYRAGHVVYWVPGDLVKPVDFYVKRLGFKLTDEGPSMRFMRCSGSADHHSLLLQREGSYLGFQHVAYEFKDFDEVMMAGCNLEQQGWKTNTGPIRHNISSSCSWYFWNPAGGVAEAFSDMDCVDDNWVVGYHDPSDPGFYGVSWAVRPGKRRARPAEWIDDSDD